MYLYLRSEASKEWQDKSTDVPLILHYVEAQTWLILNLWKYCVARQDTHESVMRCRTSDLKDRKCLPRRLTLSQDPTSHTTATQLVADLMTARVFTFTSTFKALQE